MWWIAQALLSIEQAEKHHSELRWREAPTKYAESLQRQEALSRKRPVQEVCREEHC